MSAAVAGHDALLVEPYGDSALLVRERTTLREEAWRTAHRLASALRAERTPGVESVMATFDALLIEFDPLETDVVRLVGWLQAHRDVEVARRDPRLFRIPLVYGGAYGPDLADVADELGSSTDEVIAAHSGQRWRVAFNGAPAGAPLHEAQAFASPIRRMAQPRVRIPAGTVAVAGMQGTIYTVQAPGGWRLIGRTPLRIVDPARESFVAIEAGDELEFLPLSEEEFRSAPARFVGDRP